MSRTYAVILERGAHSWGAYVPDLPGCVAAGATEEEALRLIREAIVFHLEGLAEHGRRPPRPRAHAERVTVEYAQPACA